MTVPRIIANDPVVKEQVAARTFPDKYITDLRVWRDQHGNVPANVSLQAYNYDTKDLSVDDDDIEHLRIRDVWKEAARSSAFGQAMGGLIQVIFLLYREDALRKQLIEMPEGRERELLMVGFHAIQSQLGVEPEDVPAFVESEIVWAKPPVK